MAGDTTRTITITFRGDAKGVEESSAAAAAAIKEVSAAADDNTKITSKQAKALSDAGKETESFGKKMESAGKSLDAASKTLTGLNKPLAAVAKGLTVLSTANKVLPAISSNAVAMSGTLGLAAGAVGVLGAAFAVVKLGSAGVSAAFAHVADGAKKSIANTFQKDLIPSTKATSAVFKALTPDMDGVAKSTSGVFNSITKMLTTKSSISSLKLLFDSAGISVKKWGAAFAPLLHGVIVFVSQAAKQFATLGNGAGAWATNLDKKITKFATDGRLQAWIKNAIAEFKDLKAKGDAAAGLLDRIFHAVSPLASIKVTVFSDMAKAFGPALLNGLTVVSNFLAQNPQLANYLVGAALGVALLSKSMSGLGGAMSAIKSVADGGWIGLIILAVAAIVIGFIVLWKKSAGFRDFWIGLWHDIQNVIQVLIGWWNGTAVPWIKEMFAPVHDALNAIGQAWQAFWGGWFGGIVRAELSAFLDYLRGYAEVLSVVWDALWQVLKGLFKGFCDWISALWKGFWEIIKGIFEVFAGVFSGNWSKVWQGLKDIFGGVLDILKGWWKSFGDFFGGIGNAIGAVVQHIGTLWDGLKNIFKAPVEFVVNAILNPFIGGLDALLGMVGIPKIPKIPGFDAGGYTGDGGRLQPAGIVHKGEYVVPAHRVNPSTLPVLEGLRQTGNLPGYSVGGLVSGIGDFVSGAVSDLSGWMTDPLGQIEKLLTPSGGPAGAIASALEKIPMSFAGDIAKWVKGKMGSLFGMGNSTSGKTFPSAQHAALLASAIALTGATPPAAWMLGLNTLITRESSWNPNAINLTDSNAKAGHPSQGLGQTIPGTFEQYRLPSLPDVITNPLSNVVAVIRYIMDRYHGIQNVQQANPNLPPKGYASGGIARGMFIAGENGPELVTAGSGTARVTNAAQTAAMLRGAQGGDIVINIGNETVARITQAQIDASNRNLRRKANAARRH